MSLLKRIERCGRRLLVALVAALLGLRPRPLALPAAPGILVIRLDERVGNLLMVVPLLDSLRRRLPQARLELLGSVKARTLLAGHPCLDEFLPFRKRALCAADGPLRLPLLLRRRRYDLCIDAGNPTDPSVTQVILTRLSGARHTIGIDNPDFGRLYSAPVQLAQPNAHEIDLRLALLDPVPGEELSRRVFLGDLSQPPADSPVASLIRLQREHPFAVLNVGARLREKMLPTPAYVTLAEAVAAAGFTPVVTFGPTERPLAEAVVELCPTAQLAPPTGLLELAFMMSRARLVITCDTGPMHLAVAVATPTCGIFVNTEPERYGYPDAPHRVVDARRTPIETWLPEVRAWLAVRQTASLATALPGHR